MIVDFLKMVVIIIIIIIISTYVNKTLLTHSGYKNNY